MRRSVFVFILLLCAGTLRAGFFRTLLIPWGAGQGKLLFEKQASGGVNGPASICLFKSGCLAVLDSRGSSIELFTGGQGFSGSIELPESTEHDCEMLFIDMARASDGGFWLLEKATRSVYHLGFGGELGRAHSIPTTGPGPVYLGGLCCDGSGRVTVLNAFDNGLTRFVPGEDLRPEHCHAAWASSLVLDSAGRFIGLRQTSESSIRSYQLLRGDPFSQDSQTLTTISFKNAVVSCRVVGCDKVDRIYVESAQGTVENPVKRKLSIYSPAGRLLKSVPMPNPPLRLEMTRSRMVSPDGVVYAVHETRKGLKIIIFQSIRPPKGVRRRRAF